MPRHSKNVSLVKTWKTSLSDNPGICHARCLLRDEDIANGSDIDDQRINLSLERHNRIVNMILVTLVTTYFCSLRHAF